MITWRTRIPDSPNCSSLDADQRVVRSSQPQQWRRALGRTRIALIIDNLRLTRWQAEALEQLGDSAEYVILNCTNTSFRRRPLRHALYYLLNFACIRTSATRAVPLPPRMSIIAKYDFAAEQDGAWQRLPPDALHQLRNWSPEIAVKFGMGLLRVPPELECKILSYHHGDPRRFRGRPAGFYELLGSVSVVGQIVQIISNRLDGGAVVAFAETRAIRHSYRATMAESYSVSPLLLRTAIRNCLAGNTLEISPEGKNYRLPSNWTVARFAVMLLFRKLSRIVRASLFYKVWEVATVDESGERAEQLLEAIADDNRWQVVPIPARYRFLADPFFDPRSGILAEGLRRTDGQGEIVRIAESDVQVICKGRGHFSYPATVRSGTEWFVVPEVSEWAGPRLYRLTGSGAELAGELDVEGSPRLVDATLYSRPDGAYLFGSLPAETPCVLRLWTAPGLTSKFVEHPASPVRISPIGARMGGSILELTDGLIRVGQDCSGKYGDGLALFRIRDLSHSSYGEEQVARMSFSKVRGPHTLNRSNGRVLFDFYRERFALGSGLLRLRAAYSKRVALARQTSR